MAVMVKNTDPLKVKTPSQGKIKEMVNFILKKEKKRGWLVEVTFVCDRRMRGLNQKYRGKDKTTDVLSFEMGEDGILGDIFISKKQAVKNAKEYGGRVDEEVCRLLVHGTLHLLGYKHGPKMLKKQEELLCRAS